MKRNDLFAVLFNLDIAVMINYVQSYYLYKFIHSDRFDDQRQQNINAVLFILNFFFLTEAFFDFFCGKKCI